MSLFLKLLYGLFYTVGTAFMVSTGHDGTAAEFLNGLEDALVVGGDIGLVDNTDSLFVDSLDDWFASKHG